MLYRKDGREIGYRKRRILSQMNDVKAERYLWAQQQHFDILDRFTGTESGQAGWLYLQPGISSGATTARDRLYDINMRALTSTTVYLIDESLLPAIESTADRPEQQDWTLTEALLPSDQGFLIYPLPFNLLEVRAEERLFAGFAWSVLNRDVTLSDRSLDVGIAYYLRAYSHDRVYTYVMDWKVGVSITERFVRILDRDSANKLKVDQKRGTALLIWLFAATLQVLSQGKLARITSQEVSVDDEHAKVLGKSTQLIRIVSLAEGDELPAVH
jgi:hypothetical protein